MNDGISFKLTEEQENLMEEAKQFAKNSIRPLIEEMNKERKLNENLVNEIKQKFSKYWVPPEYGGNYYSTIDNCIIAEELAAEYGSCLTIFEVAGLSSQPILKGGTQEQKEKFLRPFAEGKYYFSFCLTDSGAPGSDPLAMTTTATKDGDYYILNGGKRLVTNVDFATHFLIFAKTNPEMKARGISAFLVPKNLKGWKEISRVQGWGMNAHFISELKFENLAVPKEFLIGNEGEGFIYSLKGLDKTRLSLAAGMCGIGREAIKIGIEYLKNHPGTFDKPLTERQALTYKLISLHTKVEAARLLAWRAAKMEDMGLRHSAETSMSKWFACETAVSACLTVIRMMAGDGWKNDRLNIMLHDAMAFSNAQGTTQIHKMIIGREVFKIKSL
ncbi:MAG: acyl-CoA dehydrogenase family protein [Promethearchaeota archaeon]